MKSNQGRIEPKSSRNTFRHAAVLGIALLILAGLGIGCSKQGRVQSALAKADQYFSQSEYAKAEIEYLNVLRLEPANTHAITRLGLLYSRQGNLSKGLSALRKAYTMDTNNVDIRIAFAQLMLSLGEYPYAYTEARNVVMKQPTNEPALLILADASVGTNALQLTRQRLQTIVNQNPQNAPAQLALGSVLLRLGLINQGAPLIQKALAANPKSAAAHAAMASLCLASNDLQGAEAALKTAADLSPAHSARQIRYADFKIRAGEIPTARKFLEDLAKRAPDYYPVWIQLAELDLAANKPKEALDNLDRVLANDPGNYEAIVLTARVKLLQKETAQAVAELEKLTQGYPKMPHAFYQLAVAHLANRDTAKAGAALDKALTLAPYYDEAELLRAEITALRGEHAAAADALRALIRRRPEMVKAHQSLIQAYLAQRNLDAALTACQQMARIFPKSPQPLYQSGLLQRELNRPAEARASFERAWAMDTNFLPAIHQLVSLDVQEKRFDSALTRAESIVRRLTNAAGPRVMLSGVHLARGATNLAEAALLEAIRLEPTNVQPYLLLAPIYLQSGRKAEAIRAMDALIAKDPAASPAYIVKGSIYEEESKFQEARQEYEKAIETAPRFAPALKRAASLYAEHLNDLDKAYDLASRAHELDRLDSETTELLGWISFKQGKYPAAVSLLQESMSRLAARPETLYRLGLAQYMLGAEGAARAAFQQALKATNTFPSRADAEKRLAFLDLNINTATASTLAALQKHLETNPSDPIALARLGALHEKNKEYDKAIATYERALQLNPNAIAIMAALATLHSTVRNDQAKALELARNARNLAPEDPNAAWLLGRLNLNGGDHRLALSLLQEAAQKFPGQPAVQYDLALALYCNGKVNEANDAMRAALGASPASPQNESARRFLALSLLHTDPQKARAAAAEIDAALKANPDYLPALIASAVLQQQSGNAPAARQTCERILKNNPQFTPALRLLGLLLAASPADEQRAYELCQRALDASPDDLPVLRATGILASRRGDHVRALSLLQNLVLKQPGDAEALFYLGKSQAAQRNRTEAAESLRQAIALNLKSPMLEEARRLLDTLK